MSIRVKQFENICKMTQEQVKKYVVKKLRKKGYEPIVGDGYVYAKGKFPVLLVAHMDTVHKETVNEFRYTSDGDWISSPQGIGGDDRCGIYMILDIIEDTRCSVLFTEDEEIGMVGASKFAKSDLIDDIKVNYIIELDRRGDSDAVFYDCENDEFTDFICDKDEEGWVEQWGSFSDISTIAPVMKTAAVNFSCGYYGAHTLSEYVSLSQMYTNIERVKHLLKRTDKDKFFEYIEAPNRWGGYGKSYGYYGGYGYGYDGCGFEDDGGYSDYFKNKSSSSKSTNIVSLKDDVDEPLWLVEAIDPTDGGYIVEEFEAKSKLEAIGLFLMLYEHMTYGDILYAGESRDCYAM